ncbi:MAG: transcriptional repressor [Pseudomonadota bacterium]
MQDNAPALVVGRGRRVPAPKKQASRVLSRNERLVHEVLCDSDKPLKAYGILDRLKDHGLRAPMTVYRALETLVEKGCVKKILSINAFIAVRPDRPNSASAILICRECMRAKEIALDDAQVESLYAPFRVSPGDVCIETFGECSKVCEAPSDAQIGTPPR